MKLFKLTLKDGHMGYDSYDSVIVAAKNEADAVRISPDTQYYPNPWTGDRWERKHYGSWHEHIDGVEVEYIGTAKKGTPVGVVLASFNAG